MLWFGYTIHRVWIIHQQAWGYIAVDQNTHQVRLHLNPADFKDGKVKRVILDVTYGARIPIQDETRE